MTRFVFVSFCLLAYGTTSVAQQPAKTTFAGSAVKATSASNDIFSGTVSASLPDSVTVVRKVPARPDEARTFIVDKDTKIEGKLKVNARVTVRFSAEAGGEVRALRVIVRPDAKAGTGKAQTATSGK